MIGRRGRDGALQRRPLVGEDAEIGDVGAELLQEVGDRGHVAGELFKMMAGVNLVHVPYRGAGLWFPPRAAAGGGFN